MDDRPMKTPLVDLRRQAAAHYEEAANAIHHFSSFVKDAIMAYNPELNKHNFTMQAEIKRLIEEREKLNERVKKINIILSTYQELCDHKTVDGKNAFSYEGHDSRDDFYRCEICNKTESR